MYISLDLEVIYFEILLQKAQRFISRPNLAVFCYIWKGIIRNVKLRVKYFCSALNLKSDQQQISPYSSENVGRYSMK